MDEEPQHRVDGFHSPAHPFQLASWLLYFSFVASFYALFLSPLDGAGRIAAGVVYGIFALLTLVGAVSATARNPADPLIYSPDPLNLGLYYCYRCKKNVQPSSKHCTICRKCVDVFDRAFLVLRLCFGSPSYLSLSLCSSCAPPPSFFSSRLPRALPPLA